MTKQLIVEGSDPLLLPFLQTHDPSLAERFLTELIQNHADPIIVKILKSKLRLSLNGWQSNQENHDALEIGRRWTTTPYFRTPQPAADVIWFAFR